MGGSFCAHIWYREYRLTSVLLCRTTTKVVESYVKNLNIDIFKLIPGASQCRNVAGRDLRLRLAGRLIFGAVR